VAAADGPKRVLVVHSFGSAAPPFTTHSIAFETALTGHLGERVDLDEVSLDHARHGDADMEEALVDYMGRRQANWQPDLVVPIGSPAGVFVAKYRGRLFPQTPILYTGMDRRRLPADELQKNAAFVGATYDGPGFIEDILQLAPDTTNIVCVIGASAVERYWTEAFQSDFAQFTNRVSFRWMNDLSFDQMLEHMKGLPPHSFIFLILLIRDAAGVTHNADVALRRIREVANAPVNGIFEEQLGLGIVGGRLYRAEFEGAESARMAIRIFRGEAPSNLPPVIVGPIGSQYDWRELRRWKISEDRLPRGSIVKYRVPTIWERHRTLVISGVSVLVVQAVLIGGLALTLSRRRRAERSLRESEERVKLAAGAADLRLWEWEAATGRVWVIGPLAERIGPGKGDEAHFEDLFRTVHPDDRKGVDADLKKSLRGGGGFENIHRRILPGGKVLWVAARGRVEFDETGKPRRMRGMSMDITALKLAEEQAKRAQAEAQRLEQELEHVNRVSTLGVLAGSLAHELNQPLTSILSNAAAARLFMNREQINGDEVRDALKDIQRQGRRAGEIITGMRGMLKKDPGEIAGQDLNLAVREVIEMVQSDLASRHVTPVLRLDPLLPPVQGHGVQLRQVVLNLAMNACDAMSDVPSDRRMLTIESRRVTAGVEVSVADCGSGFPEEMLGRAFEPFHTTKAKGLGLGLAICGSIIGAHGGRLAAANNRDKGATVKFILPALSENGIH
jgi:signal transduction histidine kinase